MLMNPAIQKTAQEQIDRVVGRHCFPESVDRNFLPYITAILYEVLRCVMLFGLVNNLVNKSADFRWRPVAPLGTPDSYISPLVARFSCYTTC